MESPNDRIKPTNKRAESIMGTMNHLEPFGPQDDSLSELQVLKLI